MSMSGGVTWARWGATRQVSSGIKDYFRTLYGDDRIESKLIGIGLVDVYRQAVGKLIMDIGEPLFKRLLKREFKYAGKNVDLLEDYLTTRVLNLEQEGREEVLGRVYTYRDLTGDSILGHIASFDAGGRPGGDIAEEAKREANRFYSRIGL